MIYALIFVIIILLMDLIITKRESKTKEIDIIENNKIDYSLSYSKKEYLLTRNELKFYKLLKSIIDKNNLNLFCQVSLYELVKSNNYKNFNKIKAKTIDYVITDINCKIKLCIELDDPTHIRQDRIERDKFIDELFKQLEIKLIRIPVQNWYDIKTIEEKIKESL